MNTDENNINILELFDNNQLVKVCAPMVRYSKLQFRTLVRQYNCDLCYTPMILADSFCQSVKARNNEFTTNERDAPLVVQFAANTVHDFVGAAYLASPFCNGVDLNCGCPQRWARQMNLGSSLLEKPELIADLVKQVRNRIAKPFTVSVKLRLLRDQKKMLNLCKQIEEAGVSYLSIHGRTINQNTGDANSDSLCLINESVACPVIANGNIKTLRDCYELQKKTKCAGVMVANGLLTNPTLFTETEQTSLDCVQKWIDICYNSTLKTAFNPQLPPVLTIEERPPNLTFQVFHHHLVFMLEKLLDRKKRRVFNNLQTFKDVLCFLNDEFLIRPRLFSEQDFIAYQQHELDYKDRDHVYNQLKPKRDDHQSLDFTYEYSNDGKYFNSKISDTEALEYDLSNIFF